MLSLRYCTQHSIPLQRFSLNFQEITKPCFLHSLYSSPAATRRLHCSFKLNNQNEENLILQDEHNLHIPFICVEDAMVSYMFGRKKATQVAHSVWKHIVQKGDTVVDATCGNGHDTLEMLRMVADETGRGRVYGMDVQKDALQSTYHLLDESISSTEKELVKLIPMCHSKMEEVVPEDISVRLVAFNLGYLPGGDKAVTTRPETTLLALKAAERILGSGGLISLVVYIGHPGGSEELQTVEDFASGLSAEDWVCSKFQMLNRPLAPVPVFLFKK